MSGHTLIIFIDQYRANLMRSINPDATETHLERELKQLGGTLFSQCFTPSPNTYSSLGSFWTGCYPSRCGSEHGYLDLWGDKSLRNLLTDLTMNGLEFNTFSSQHERLVSIFPEADFSRGCHRSYDQHKPGTELSGFLRAVDWANSSLTFIALLDFYSAMNRFRHDWRAFKTADSIIAREVREVIEYAEPLVETVVVFSDHGFKFSHQRGYEHFAANSNSDRLQTLLHWREGDQPWRIETKLTSIMDVYPTILRKLGLPELRSSDGKDLFSEQSHPFVAFQDTFSNSKQSGTTWGLIGNSWRYCSNGVENVEVGAIPSHFSASEDEITREISDVFPNFSRIRISAHRTSVLASQLRLRRRATFLDGTTSGNFRGFSLTAIVRRSLDVLRRIVSLVTPSSPNLKSKLQLRRIVLSVAFRIQQRVRP